MECESCKFTEADKSFIFGSEYWRVFLNSDQAYLGRSVVSAKRHCGSISELTNEEWLDFLNVVKKMEAVFTKTFGAKMFNWTCMMNHSFRGKSANPHLRWHFRPRYNKKVKFAGQVFEDLEFGEHYSYERIRKVDDNLMREIINKIRGNLR